MMRTLIVIPARYASSRFPGKPLADICGKPMIQHVYERACCARSADRAIVATDDNRIANAVKRFGGEAMMTSPDHRSGTDRVVEVSKKIQAQVYINVQGDEPLIRPDDIDRLADAMHASAENKIMTLYHPIDAQEAQDINTVKLITTHSGNILYFSRLPIPFMAPHAQKSRYMKHIGIYAYRSELLCKYSQIPASELESMECLEQLRLLQADVPIGGIQTRRTGPGVDTPNDIEQVEKMIHSEFYDASSAENGICINKNQKTVMTAF
ncbi:MAG: 3-deoxy-manno-octulosonate cytidylyltransferase [Desulfobacteraceae bacterium]|nr:3-deoxy-manno-octulosonate cytidylyltransferase [Desulfobacteraceae bacterium]